MAALAATRLVDEPIILRVPPSIVANESGISSALDETPMLDPQLARIGIIIAQTWVRLRAGLRTRATARPV